MAWYDRNSWLTFLLSGSPLSIVVSVLITVLLPTLIHYLFYQKSTSTKTPSFLIVGPTNAGKTCLASALETGQSTKTHMSLNSQTLSVTLPSQYIPKSLQYRSSNDIESKQGKTITLYDTPGHAKRRHLAYDILNQNYTSLTGIIFVVDPAGLGSTSDGASSEFVRDTTNYLYDVLLWLQRRHQNTKESKIRHVPVLIAATKADLFTGLPERLAVEFLATELNSLRSTRARGLATMRKAGKDDHGDHDDDEASEPGNKVLASHIDNNGSTGMDGFSFKDMEEYDIYITLKEGSCQGEIQTEKWWEWIAERI